MKLSTILSTLAEARLPSVTAEQLQQLVGTAEGKAFADDVRWFAAGDTGRRAHLAAVVHCLSPGVRRSVEQLGLEFDVLALIRAAKLDGEYLFHAITNASAGAAGRAQLNEYLQGIGLKTAPAPPQIQAKPIKAPYFSFKIFSNSAALCISEARTRVENQCTIQIEGALLLAGGGRTQFDWPNKITVQLTVQEAYQALALFENLIPRVKFDGHGRAHDKSLQIEFQETHYFAKLVQRGRAMVAVPIPAVDSIRIVSLLYRQLCANDPHLRLDDVKGLVGRLALMSRPR